MRTMYMGKFNFLVGVVVEIKKYVLLRRMVRIWELLIWKTL